MIQKKAVELWDNQDALVTRHTRGTETYNSRLLALLLMNSLTADVAAMLHGHIDPKVQFRRFNVTFYDVYTYQSQSFGLF